MTNQQWSRLNGQISSSSDRDSNSRPAHRAARNGLLSFLMPLFDSIKNCVFDFYLNQTHLKSAVVLGLTPRLYAIIADVDFFLKRKMYIYYGPWRPCAAAMAQVMAESRLRTVESLQLPADCSSRKMLRPPPWRSRGLPVYARPYAMKNCKRFRWDSQKVSSHAMRLACYAYGVFSLLPTHIHTNIHSLLLSLK